MAYTVYCISAYSLVILIAALPMLVKRIKQHKANVLNRSKLIQKVSSSAFGDRYLHDLAFRGSVSIYQGMIVNFLYVLFQIAAGIRYASAWFISMAVYYMVLGGLRAYPVSSDRHKGAYGLPFEYRCYRRTAWLLFLLDIPMGGMIVLMVRTNSGFSYPGYVIYLSALYTLLYDEHICYQPCEIPENRQSDPLCRKGAELCVCHDVGSRPADGDDLPLFNSRRRVS